MEQIDRLINEEEWLEENTHRKNEEVENINRYEKIREIINELKLNL